ncbi:MFS transporter [Niveispirillum sp. KHB5.9]|uniref:MFS transporter n=1 Tax=Niveispirillum sp. KHB5.9 TaxID=3400269 RepID=UPI003A875FA6
MQASDENAGAAPGGGPAVARPLLSSRQIWNMCCGLFGVQIVWGLHNVNTSRIFQALGVDIADLPILWIAAPITGLLVQPIVGYLSDRTWTPLGRRRPYLLAGAVLSALALCAMPNASTLWACSMTLWLLTAAINIAMEPFRALVADTLPDEQRTRGFATQVFFIGAGAVFASVLPWVMARWFGMSARGDGEALPPSVRAAFYVGALCLLVAVVWTVVTTPERPCARPLAKVTGDDMSSGERGLRGGALWMVGGFALFAFALSTGQEREIHFIAGLAVAFGLAQIAVAWARRRGAVSLGMLEIVEDILHMPAMLKRLALVQFFTWFGLFAMWIYTVPAVAARHYGTSDAASAAYNAGADWVGVLFAGYNGVAALAALALPAFAERVGRRACHAVCLLLGALGLAGFRVIDDPMLLWLPAVAIGIAWAAILSIPYAMLSSAIPPQKAGVYMGIHNIFLVLPQLVAATILGPLVGRAFGGQAIHALSLAALSLVLAAVCTLAIPRSEKP